MQAISFHNHYSIFKFLFKFSTLQKRKKFEHLEKNILVIIARRRSYFCNYLTALSRFHYQNQKKNNNRERA